MLEIRPVCEHCRTPLPPDAVDAMICSFECTFCRSCVDSVLDNVCPNCGGGLCPRPVRPTHNWKGDNFLGKFPAGTTLKYRPVDVEAHREWSKPLRAIPPERR